MFSFFKKKTLPGLFFHTDLHCHLVPGIDDGQTDPDEAASLVKIEKEWGIERIFCTPHITQDVFENTPEIISAAFARLKEAVGRHGIDMPLDYSAEHRLDGFFLSQLEKGAIRSFPNNYLLVENPFVQEAMNFDQNLFDISIKGYTPILAHPERYGYYFDKPQRYKQIHQNGALFQVNLLSLTGYYGKEVKKMAEWLIAEDLVDFIGTDMHNRHHADAITAYLSTKDYKRHAKALDGRILNDKAF